MPRDIRAEAEQYLQDQGGFYTFDDLLAAVREGRMQSFTDGNTLVVTQVHDFPRKRVLEVAYIFGDRKGYVGLEPEVEKFRDKVGAEMMIATGRTGWLRKKLDGWEPHSVNFVKV